MKVKNDHHSEFSNLSNWKDEAEKITASTGFENVTRSRILRTGIAKVTGIAYRYRGGHRFESCWSLYFLRLLLSNCLSHRRFFRATDINRKFMFLPLARFYARPLSFRALVLAFTTWHFHRKRSNTRQRGEIWNSGWPPWLKNVCAWALNSIQMLTNVVLPLGGGSKTQVTGHCFTDTMAGLQCHAIKNKNHNHSMN